jgi:hypothetical protein
MRTTKRQKIDRESTAAYAASQPLFDALRHGAERAGEQKIYLSKARDIVQNLHVKLADASLANDTLKHDGYLTALTNAWASATNAYCNIFEELCRVTAPDMSEGREAASGYEQFKAMAESAAAAKEAAAGFKPQTKSRSATPSKSVFGSKRMLSSGFKGADEVESPYNDAQVGAEASGRRGKRQKHEDWHANRRHQPTEGAAIDASQREQRTAATAAERIGATGKENRVPGVEYEDVTAEVAARLKAKEEKKRAKKEQKKRKLESTNSELIDDATISERPSKKRSRTAEAPISHPHPQSASKRKQDDTLLATDGGAKKRKIAKI